jgi:hypothetical protein
MIQVIVATVAYGWERAVMRSRKQDGNDLGPILREVEGGERPEWNDIADRSPTYKSFWVQWNSLEVRDGVLERHWQSVDGTSKTAQIRVVLPRSKAKKVSKSSMEDFREDF